MGLKLGSLFSGSGGFELAGLLNGIEPVWDSEVEPFPIRVTTKRLPQVKQVGDINELDGAELEPVDIITFGSPCQDMSLAGKRAGLNGERSGLFHQAVRIIREMREKTNGRYPRYAVWENVTGAYSSNGGRDFQSVLTEICRIADREVPAVPLPEKGRWPGFGALVGEGWSIAYRTLDAQYCGVPQRRRRIYLVADFAGERAAEILSEPEGVPGHPAPGLEAWQRFAGAVEAGSGETGGAASAGFCTEHSAASRGIGWQEEVAPTLRAGVVPAAQVYENHSQDTRYTGPLDVAPTVSATYGTGGNNQPFVVPQVYHVPSLHADRGKCRNPGEGIFLTETSRTIDTKGGTPDCNQGGMAVVESSTNDKALLKSRFWDGGDVSATLTASNAGGQQRMPDKHNFQAVVESRTFDVRQTSEGTVNARYNVYESDKSRTLDCGGNNPHSNQGGIAVVEDVYAATAGGFTQVEHEKSPTLMARDWKDPGVVCYGMSREAYNQGKFVPTFGEELQPTIVARGPGAVKCGYAVRRLTPTECARLQGFPDWWCADLGTEEPSKDEMEFWRGVFNTYSRMLGKKPRSDNQIRKWLRDPVTDSAMYKLWGNGIALPCASFVLGAIAAQK